MKNRKIGCYREHLDGFAELAENAPLVAVVYSAVLVASYSSTIS
jgi:hypothetical protein